jgi:branched-subunit amino acid transport protein
VNIWLVMLLVGLIIFCMRFSPIYLLAEGRFEIPEQCRDARALLVEIVFI